MYSIHSEFDIQKHKETYTNYLEVIIHPNGKIEYAIPSHQYKLEMIASSERNVSIKEIRDMCPECYYCDYNIWLCSITGCILVWTNYLQYYKVTRTQSNTLRKLKIAGLYNYQIPRGGTINEQLPILK